MQGELETWLGRVIGSDPPRLVCAGRTDAGVHARGQVAHLDLDPEAIPNPAAAVSRLNRVLSDDLVVWRLTPAPAGFDARFSAVWRRYVYRLVEPYSPIHPLYRNQVTRLHRELDLEQMNAAAQGLLGLRDFGAFCRGREGGTTIRTLLDLRATRVTAGAVSHGGTPPEPAAGLGDVIECTVRADAFCHSMVRSLVGALVEIGSGRRDAGWLETVAAAGVRDPAIPVLAPGGLTLEEVGYPADAELAERARQARSLRSVADA